MQSSFYHIYRWFVAPLLATTSCILAFTPGGPGDLGEATTRLPPLASAGADREILRGFTARLEGSASYSPSGRPFTTRWEQLVGIAVHLSNEASMTPTFLAPLEEQMLSFKLTVDDGTWVTTDEVSLLVKRQPLRTAPRVRAGPDRLLEANEDGPTTTDVTDTVSDDITLTWEEVQASPSPLPTLADDAEAITGSVYRLVAERDGLRSAPDYLVLFPPDDRNAGARAPVAILEAPGNVAPGEKIHLDATLSSDANGDPLRFRWEQVRGEPQSGPWPTTATTDIVAPSRPQELLFYVFVSDGMLESAPANASIRVKSAGAPFVAPQVDSRTHPNNTFILDADGIPTPAENEDITFSWQQTYGEVVVLSPDTMSGRFATFDAPANPGDLAFVVFAELPDGAVAVTSEPAVARVTVVDPTDNLAPLIYLCAASTNPASGPPLQVITALVVDPEADPLLDVVWSATSNPPVLVVLEERAEEDIVDAPPCAINRDLETAGLTSTSSVVYQADFISPAAPTTVTVTLSACDGVGAGACAIESTEIIIPVE